MRRLGVIGAVADAAVLLSAGGHGLACLQAGGQFAGQNPASESLYLLATASQSQHQPWSGPVCWF